MPFKRFVETGRVALVSDGPDKGKLVSIVDVIDQTRVLIDGPLTNVTRGQIRLNQLHLTKFRIKFPFTAPSKLVRQAWVKGKINEKWANSMWAKKIEAKAKRAEMGDFDRFKLRRARQKRNKLRTTMFFHMKMKASRNGTLYGKKTMTKGGNKPKPKKLKASKVKPGSGKSATKATEKPVTEKPDAEKSAVTKSAVAKSTTAKSATAKSAIAKSATAKPAAGKSATTKPGAAKSATSKPGAAKSATSKQAKPTTGKPGTSKPAGSKSTTAKSKAPTEPKK